MSYECPNCGRKAVETRGARTPRNLKLREVDNLLAQYVCRNPECKWTGDEDDLAEDTRQPPEDHESALQW